MLALGLAAFAMFGVVLVLLGATADALRETLGLSLSQYGLLGSAFAGGMGLGVVGAGPLVDRFPRRPIFLVASLLTAASIAMIDDGISYPWLVTCVVAMGCGSGVYDTLLNTVTAEKYAERSVSMLSLLHAAVTIGAMVAPLVIERVLSTGSFTPVFRGTALAFLVLSAFIALVPLPAPPAATGRPVTTKLFTPAFLALCLVGFCYVGVEAGLVLFAVPYATEGVAIGAETGRMAISGFWLGILAARGVLALPRANSSTPPGLLAGTGMAGAALLATGLALEWTALPWLFAAMGAVLGAVFPMMIAWAASWNPGAAGSATGIVAGAGSLGAAIVPWLTGLLGDVGGVAIGMASLCGWCGVMAVAATIAARSHAKQRVV